MSVEISSTLPTDVEQIELFSLDGVSYSIPKRPRVNLALKYMKMVKTHGDSAAGGFLLEELVGTDAYDALCDCDALTSENLNEIIAVAQKVTLGGLESPNG